MNELKNRELEITAETMPDIKGQKKKKKKHEMFIQTCGDFERTISDV